MPTDSAEANMVKAIVLELIRDLKRQLPSLNDTALRDAVNRA